LRQQGGAGVAGHGHSEVAAGDRRISHNRLRDPSQRSINKEFHNQASRSFGRLRRPQDDKENRLLKKSIMADQNNKPAVDPNRNMVVVLGAKIGRQKKKIKKILLVLLILFALAALAELIYLNFIINY
jgi:hypothetical protein